MWTFKALTVVSKILFDARISKYLSCIMLVINGVFWSSTVFAAKVEMELLQCVFVTLQGTPTEFSASFWAVNVKSRSMTTIHNLSRHQATRVVESYLQRGIAFFLHLLCYDVDWRLKFSSTQWVSFGPVCWTRSYRKP